MTLMYRNLVKVSIMLLLAIVVVVMLVVVVISSILSILEKCDVLCIVYRSFQVIFLLLCQTIVVLFIKLNLEASMTFCSNLW